MTKKNIAVRFILLTAVKISHGLSFVPVVPSVDAPCDVAAAVCAPVVYDTETEAAAACNGPRVCFVNVTNVTAPGGFCLAYATAGVYESEEVAPGENCSHADAAWTDLSEEECENAHAGYDYPCDECHNMDNYSEAWHGVSAMISEAPACSFFWDSAKIVANASSTLILL